MGNGIPLRRGLSGHVPFAAEKQSAPMPQTASAARPAGIRRLSPPQRYNTLDFALPAIKRLRRLMASLGDCRQSLSLVRRCRTSCKAVCQGDAFPVGSSATKPPVSLDSSGQRERRPLWIPRPKEGRHPPLVSSQKQNRMCLLISTFRSAFTEKRKRNRPVLCFFKNLLKKQTTR